MKTPIIIGVVALIVSVLSTFYFFAGQKNESLPKGEDLKEIMADQVAEFAAEYEKRLPLDSEIDATAVIQQVADLSLLTAALQAHHKANNGLYPETLQDLIPELLPPAMLEGGVLPTDADGTSFQYQLRDSGYEYLICFDDLEEGGRSCLGSNRDGEFISE